MSKPNKIYKRKKRLQVEAIFLRISPPGGDRTVQLGARVTQSNDLG